MSIQLYWDFFHPQTAHSHPEVQYLRFKKIKNIHILLGMQVDIINTWCRRSLMRLKGVKIGYGFTGAYCVFDQTFLQLERLVAEGAEVIPIVSHQVAVTDSRYGNAADFLARMKNITGKTVIQTLADAEIYNKTEKPMDILIISPCTGCSLSKLSDGATDTPVLMTAKELFRNNKPVLLGIATNDGLGISAKSIGILLGTKNIYFIPFGQDNPKDKPNSIVAKFELTIPSVIEALKREQIQPVLEKY